MLCSNLHRTLLRPRLLAAVLMTLAAAAVSGTARADMLAYTSTGSDADPLASFTIGYGFTSANPIQVTALGVYDNDSDGLSVARTVGIWLASSKTLLASVTVPAGTGGTLNGGFRFLTLASTVSLAAGTGYVIGVEYPNDMGIDDKVINSTQTPAAGITLGVGSFIASAATALTYPAGRSSAVRSTGNFLFANAVPEPSTWALLGAGAGLLGVGILRRRAVRA